MHYECKKQKRIKFPGIVFICAHPHLSIYFFVRYILFTTQASWHVQLDFCCTLFLCIYFIAKSCTTYNDDMIMQELYNHFSWLSFLVSTIALLIMDTKHESESDIVNSEIVHRAINIWNQSVHEMEKNPRLEFCSPKRSKNT